MHPMNAATEYEELDWVKYKCSALLLGMVLKVKGSTLVISSHSGLVEVEKGLLEKCTSKGMPLQQAG